MSDHPIENSGYAHRFQQEFTKETFTFLANLLGFNLDSRRLMANGIANALYAPLRNRDGAFTATPDTARSRLLNVTTLEILAKAYWALEDLGKILICVQALLPRFPHAYVALQQKKSLAVFGVLAEATESALWSVLPLWNAEQYGLRGEHAAALAQYNQHVTSFFRRFLSFLADFTERHSGAYNRYKHGMPVIVGLDVPALSEGIDGIIGIIRDGKDISKAGMMLVGDAVVRKLISLIDDVVSFSKLLVARRLQMAELSLTPLPMLCRTAPRDAGAVEIQSVLFEGIGEDVQRPMIPITQKILEPLYRTEIKVDLSCSVDQETLEDWTSFYVRDWTLRVPEGVEQIV